MQAYSSFDKTFEETEFQLGGKLGSGGGKLGSGGDEPGSGGDEPRSGRVSFANYAPAYMQ